VGGIYIYSSVNFIDVEYKKERRTDMDQSVIKEINGKIKSISTLQRDIFTRENHLLSIYCEDPGAAPKDVAERYNSLYLERDEKPLNRGKVMDFLHSCRFKHIEDRVSVINCANKTAAKIAKCIHEDKAMGALPNEKHRQFKRLVIISLVMKCSEFYEVKDIIMRLNRDFAGECLDVILDYIKAPENTDTEFTRTPSDVESDVGELERVRKAFERSNKSLNELQSSFDKRLAESCMEEKSRLFSMLNSEKYGHILDLLSDAQNVFSQMRQKKYTVPFELRNVQTLVRRLREFVEDCGITPIREAGAIMNIRAGDIEGYQYEGEPFSNPDETKIVAVVSPGWQIEDEDIIISYPRVREKGKDEL